VTAAFQLPTADDERDELEQMLGFALTPGTSDATLDSIASSICRHLGRIEADRTRYKEAEEAEHARITIFYASRKEKLDHAIVRLQEMGAEVARRATFPGKSKSRSVAFGSYGSRKVSEKIEVVDEEKATDWLANTDDASALRSKLSIDKKEATKLVLTHLHATGEIPDGFTHTEETESYFCKAEA